MASKAMNELGCATLSGKSLFVKLIPNIHVCIAFFGPVRVNSCVVLRVPSCGVYE